MRTGTGEAGIVSLDFGDLGPGGSDADGMRSWPRVALNVGARYVGPAGRTTPAGMVPEAVRPDCDPPSAARALAAPELLLGSRRSGTRGGA